MIIDQGKILACSSAIADIAKFFSAGLSATAEIIKMV